MRHFKNVMILVMTFTAVTLTSCSNDDDAGDPGTGGGASGVLVAKIDGTNFESLEISSSATVANNGQNLIIIASSSSGKAFSLSVFGFDGAGTYPIGGGINITNVGSYSETDVSNPQSPSTEIWQAPFDDMVAGEIVISEVTDAKVIGTFNFSCKNVNGDQSVKVVTDGSFDLNKQVVN
ncbi:DUF6252 family protein [Psychroserpens sp.]|uniref:DUF6252 family protein n=1 Tax=Psychroserpens sp. TaxID=2020870 RepID=UPI002B265C47|nr:DUF6252 family protein [Psychroserpens sp.]